MRSAVLLLSLLFAVAVFAVKDDVACVIHSDDCGQCVSNGCNWCSDGYCVSKESDICEAHKVATECSVKPIVQQRQRGQQRQTTADVCESITSCDTCATRADCQVCVDPTTKLYKCSTGVGGDCLAGPYQAAWEWWIPAINLDLAFAKVTGSAPCPVQLAPSANSPTIQFSFKVFIIAGSGASSIHPSYLKGLLLSFLRGIIPPGKFDAVHITITIVNLSKKRQVLDSNVHTADVLAKFTDQGTLTAQGIAATLLQEDPTSTVAQGSQPLTVSPYLPTSGSTGTQVTNRKGGNSNLHLSKGALAGIIIGCVIAGALLIAVIAWFILRRRDAYPQAFRSPAAAYRP
jgi:hypothetical protein